MNRYLKTFLPLLASPALLFTIAGSFLLSPAGVTSSFAQEAANEDGPEVLTRGPVHEAFAETIVFKPTKGILVPKAPPAIVEEVPPDQRPDGDNVTWIPGYWAWDDESNDFLWVSGIWRNVPPGRQWVPGSWQDTDGQYQWVSGYWADANAEEVEYLPEPPTSMEAGPNIPQPSNESIWISGSWLWNENRYRWRPGYWDAGQPDWDWTPAHYVWTRRGYIFVDGYWDYDVPRRGCLFAPVRFRRDFVYGPDYRYRPLIVVSTAAFLDHLFLRPRCSHYYFGDYYAPEYRRSGYFASYSYFSGRHGYDPIFAHQRWAHRDDDRWERRRADDFAFYRDNRNERPPHTFMAYQKFAERPDRLRRDTMPIATPLSQFVTTPGDKGGSRLKFKPVNEDDRKKFESHGREIRDYGRQFAKNSAVAPVLDKPGKGKKEATIEPSRVKIPRSPVLSKISDNGAKGDIPPPKHQKADIPGGAPDTQPGDPRGRGKKGKGADQQPGTPGTDTVVPGKGPKTDPGTPGGEPVDPRGHGNKGKGNDDQPGKKGKEPKTDPGNQVTPGNDTGDPRGRGNKGKGSDDQPGKKGKEPKTEPAIPGTPGGESGDPRGHGGKGKGNDDQPKRTKEPKNEPQPQPRVVEPKHEPKHESQPQPKFEPQPQPKHEPRSQPKFEPKPQPRVEPRPQPQPQPQPQPKNDKGDKGDKGDKKKDKNN